ncbi:hypothetical protein [Gemella sanguinis]
MPWAGLFMMSLLVGLVILPAWIFIGYLYGLELNSIHSSRDIFLNVARGTGALTVLLSLIIIGICKASADEKDKARFKDVE